MINIFQIKAGAILNLVGTIIIIFITHTWGMYYFKFDQIPWNNALSNVSETHNLNATLHLFQ